MGPIPEPARGPVALFVATRKGAWVLRGAPGRRRFALEGPHFLGHVVHHVVMDPRDRRTVLMAARTGHLGPTVFRSLDAGASWKEALRPPAFRKAEPGERARSVDHVFWLEPGHASERDTWYAGSSPEGLFRSEDGGDTWAPVAGFNDHPRNLEWTPVEVNATPDGALLHSIQIDPRDPRHLYVALSGGGGGVLESTDGGCDWRPLNAGCRVDFLPDPEPEFGQDPHCLQLHPLAPDVLYQQSHCGIYRLERPSEKWERIGERMPAEIGDIGFPIVRLVAAPRHRPAAHAGLVHGAATGDDGRRPRPGGALLRDHERRNLGQRGRGRVVALPRASPAAHPRAERGGARRLGRCGCSSLRRSAPTSEARAPSMPRARRSRSSSTTSSAATRACASA